MDTLGRMSSLKSWPEGEAGALWPVDLGSHPGPALLCSATLGTSQHGCPAWFLFILQVLAERGPLR